MWPDIANILFSITAPSLNTVHLGISDLRLSFSSAADLEMFKQTEERLLNLLEKNRTALVFVGELMDMRTFTMEEICRWFPRLYHKGILYPG